MQNQIQHIYYLFEKRGEPFFKTGSKGSYKFFKMAKVLWRFLNNRSIKGKMPIIATESMPTERSQNLKYLSIHLDRILAFSKHIEETIYKVRQELSALKAKYYLKLP